MRTAEHIAGSARALVLGAMALVLGFAFIPLPRDALTKGYTPEQAAAMGDYWLTSSLALFVAATCLAMGTLALLSLITDVWLRRAVAVLFMFSVVGWAGQANVFLMIYAMDRSGILETGDLNTILSQPWVLGYLLTWVASHGLGLLLLAVGIYRGRRAPRWVPALLVVFVLTQFVLIEAGTLVTVARYIVLALAYTGAANAATAQSRAIAADLRATVST